MRGNEMRTPSVSYQLFMLVLCLYALGAMGVQVVVNLSPEVRGVLYYADFGVCILFFADFVISFFSAPNRMRYFVTWGWLDLVSSIPAVDVVRWGRAARVLRVVRVLRGFRATKLLASLALQRRAESGFLAASLVALLLVVFSAIAVLQLESDPNANIKTAEDALWWSITTITTVGYGDRYPVTSEGRLVAAILMSTGVGLFGTFTGFVTAWFIGSGSSSREDELSALRAEISSLKQTIEHQAGKPTT